MQIFIVTIVVLFFTSLPLQLKATVVNVNLTSVGLNYAVAVNVSSVGRSTSVSSLLYSINDYFYYFNSSSPLMKNESTVLEACVWLTEDTTSIAYLKVYKGPPCVTKKGILHAGSATSNSVNVTFAVGSYAENARLHSGWLQSNSSIGLSYNIPATSSNSSYTPFQSLLQGAQSSSSSPSSTSMVFGLDFDSNGSGSMQLGGVKSEFSSSLEWYYQATSRPQYHQVFVENITYCGNSLLSSYSNNWPVIVDTGSVCMSLPSEFYDTFMAWFDNTTAVSLSQLSSLPAITFKLSTLTNSEFFYIPLGNLLVNASDIMNEAGAPYLHVLDNNGHPLNLRLCILRGNSVNGVNGYYASNPPKISLGSLALRSIYFAADFSTAGVGFASKGKYNAAQNVLCKAKAQCVGDQSYWYGSNTCSDPTCKNYFFTVLNKSSHKCEFTNASLTAGFFFIALIIFFEITAYFLVQYTSLGMGGGTNQVRLDPFTRLMGRVVSIFWDFIIINSKILANDEVNNHNNAQQPQQQQQQPQQQQPDPHIL